MTEFELMADDKESAKKKMMEIQRMWGKKNKPFTWRFKDERIIELGLTENKWIRKIYTVEIFERPLR